VTEEPYITLLGTPSVTIGDEPVSGFVSSKAQALVYYLATIGRPHTREALAGLLWSDVPDATARRNLRDVLSNLRRLIGSYLLITRQTVAFNREAPYVVDGNTCNSRMRVNAASSAN
jgi:DNA-binding SARP family transcriptional activator